MELMAKSNGDAKYVYAVIPTSARRDFGPIGIMQSQVYTIRYRDIEALVHDCTPETPAEEGILRQTQDSEALKRLVAAHGEVVDTAWAEAGTVLPIGFDVIIRADGTRSAEEKVRHLLKKSYDSFKVKLEEFRNKVELGVCIFWDAEVVVQSILGEDAEVRRLQADMEGKPLRLARLYRRKMAAIAARRVEEQAAHDFAGFYQRLKPCIESAQVSSVSRDPTGQMMVSLALLVRMDRVRALGEELGRLGEERGVVVRLTGPWPPYTFAAPVTIASRGRARALFSRRGARQRALV